MNFIFLLLLSLPGVLLSASYHLQSSKDLTQPSHLFNDENSLIECRSIGSETLLEKNTEIITRDDEVTNLTKKQRLNEEAMPMPVSKRLTPEILFRKNILAQLMEKYNEARKKAGLADVKVPIWSAVIPHGWPEGVQENCSGSWTVRQLMILKQAMANISFEYKQALYTSSRNGEGSKIGQKRKAEQQLEKEKQPEEEMEKKQENVVKYLGTESEKMQLEVEPEMILSSNSLKFKKKVYAEIYAKAEVLGLSGSGRIYWRLINHSVPQFSISQNDLRNWSPKDLKNIKEVLLVWLDREIQRKNQK